MKHLFVPMRENRTVVEYINDNLKSYTGSAEWLAWSKETDGLCSIIIPATCHLSKEDFFILEECLKVMGWVNTSVRYATLLKEVPDEFKDNLFGNWKISFKKSSGEIR